MSERDPKFFSELKQLNGDLLAYLKTVHEKSPYFDFTPTLEDYVGQFKSLSEQYPEKSFSTMNSINQSTVTLPSLTTSTTTLSSVPTFAPAQINTTNSSINNNFSIPFSDARTTNTAPSLSNSQQASTMAIPQFGLTPVPTTNTNTIPTLFGSVTTSNQAESIFKSPQPVTNSFAFGSAFGTAPSSGSSFFSFIAAKKEEDASTVSNNPQDTTNNSEADNDAEDDAPPPEPKIDKHVELDAKYSAKCKLYEKGKVVEGEIGLNLLGFGMLYVKALDTPNKLQVIIRQEPDLKKVLLNEVITPNIPVKPLPKAVQMVFPGTPGETRMFVAKVKDEKEANNLYQMLISVKS